MTYFYGNIYNSFKLSGTEIWIRALQVGRQPEASPGLELGLLSVPLLSENLSLITAGGLTITELKKEISQKKLIEINLAFYKDIIRVEKGTYIKISCYGCSYIYRYEEFQELNLDHIEIKYCDDRVKYLDDLEISYINLARRYQT